MSHEIYYTSAPEGMKRGSSGFCTVAASEGIPRGLLERLEALSAYRHQFSASDAAGEGRNPVSFAHWLLSVSGNNYHVLSRICDSGVDHTQRTNAFAHHLVVESHEMAAAAGGPAWMLERGVMAASWNGNVGTIGARTLPRGDADGGKCRAWERLTGDAAWGGHLADVFVKSPAKPVCILFSPGQQILPLLGETIGLLPPRARWNVTFNTYFTSMPTSATCVWRCCLAGTPAAQIGLRYAAGGVVIDLTDRGRLGVVPVGPYVTVARTGYAPATVTSATPAAASRPAVMVPQKAAPRQTPTDKSSEPATPSSEPVPDDATLDAAIAAAEAQAERQGPAPPLNATIQQRPLVKRPALPSIRSADAALRRGESEEAKAALRRRKQVLGLFAIALLALALGTVLVVVITQSSAPPDLPPEVRTRPAHAQPGLAPLPDQPSVATPVTPVVPTVPATRPPDVVLVPGPEVPATTPLVVGPLAPRKPALATFSTVMEFPTAGSGVADNSQTLSFRPAEIAPGFISGVKLLFPNGKMEYPIKDAIPGGGTFTSTSEGRGLHATISLLWKDSAQTEVAVIAAGSRRGLFDVTWRSNVIGKRPEVARVAYWLIQHSTLALEVRRTTQQVAFKPVDWPAIKLKDESTALAMAGEIPAAATISVPAGLPPGWQATWFTDWNAKDAALRSPENASQVLKFHKPGTSAAVESWFLLTFRPGFAKVESTLAKRRQEDEADLAKAQSDVRAMDAQIRQMETDSGVKETDDQMKPYLAKKAELARLAAAYQSAVAGYKELKDFDVSVDLPGGLQLTTVHFVRGP